MRAESQCYHCPSTATARPSGPISLRGSLKVMRKSAPVLTALLMLALQAAVPSARQAGGGGGQQPATVPAQGAGQATAPPSGQDPAPGTPADAQQAPRIRTGINYVRVD